MRVRLLLSLALVACAGVGCTFLVSFDEMAGGACDGGECIDASMVDDAAKIDGGDDTSATNDASAPDAPDVVYTPCKGLANGVYCADDHAGAYGGPITDLLTCDAGALFKVRHCGDAGCITMADPFPDTCNECPTKVDGVYCGRDFAGFPSTDSDILIGCQLGRVSQNFLCPHGCKSNGTAASCFPP